MMVDWHPSPPPTRPDPPLGIHMLNGFVLKVQRSENGHTYAKALLVGDKPHWVYQGKAPLHHLSDDTLITLEEAIGYGQRWGVCALCGALLTDPDSISQGLGPVCHQSLLNASMDSEVDSEVLA